MSGGSYNYLAFRSSHIGAHEYYLREMSERLNGIDSGSRAANHTAQVIDYLDKAEALASKLDDVWYAVEWRDSGDWTEEQMMEEIEKYGQG